MIGIVGGLRIACYAALGAVMGTAYFAALGWNVRLYFDRESGWRPVLLHFSRLGLAVAAFTLCARQGALPLLATLAGFLALRTISLRHHGLADRRLSTP